MSCKLIDEQVVGPLMVRYSGMLDAGHVVPGHVHNFDHTTFVFSGRVRVAVTSPGGEAEGAEYAAGSAFAVLAEDVHEIAAMEDGTSYACAFPHREPSGEVIQRYAGNARAYH